MNGFELWIFGFGSNLSTNCATTTAQEQKVLVCREKKGKVWKGNDEKTVKGLQKNCSLKLCLYLTLSTYRGKIKHFSFMVIIRN